MHLLTTTSTSLDDLVEPVDLGQAPAAMVVASFTDSDLAALAAACRAAGDGLPTLRLASLRDLRHPMSVDLWIERTARHARIVVIRLLGGLDWWRYGIDRLSAEARARGFALAVLPGEDRDDPRLSAASTVGAEELAALLAYFRAGGPANMAALLKRLAGHAGTAVPVPAPVPSPAAGWYTPLSPAGGENGARRDRPRVAVLFYRSMWLAGDTAPVDALCAAFAARGLDPLPLYVASLKDPVSAGFVRETLAQHPPDAIVALTAFAAGEPGAPSLFDALGVPVFQAVAATTPRDAWHDGARGLAPADLAMHVVLPELDGRILAGAVSFKAPEERDAALGFTGHASRAEPDRVEQVAARVAAWLKLRGTPRKRRRLAVLMPDYAGAPGRTGWAVGLDVPASVLALLSDLREAGYAVGEVPASARALLDWLAEPGGSFPLDAYRARFAGLPESAKAQVLAAWGDPADDLQLRGGAFRFRALACGNMTVAVAPDRGRPGERRADYHDPALPPRHALLAFGFWLRDTLGADAVVHMGAHGTVEWLPGKHVALTESCFPELVLGSLPVVYPFIVSNPGEAAQAKRRIAAVTLGHLPPPLDESGLAGEARALERLLDEYTEADGLDHRRRERLAALIVAEAERSGLAREAGVAAGGDALKRIDAWLCDLKELRLKDGLHVYGRGPCGEQERDALIGALDGGRVAPGPAGAPARGRADVLPTGRNLYAVDPRTLPTQTATDLGRLAAEEVLRRYLQEHGDWPRSLVLDLWGSATLRTGGEEIAHGLALLGCRPVWDAGTARVTAVEVVPPAVLGRPRVDVTFRISGLFRDLFPAQIALLDAAIRAVAARDEPAADNPLLADPSAPRIFGTAPGAYGAGLEPDMEPSDLGAAYLAAASHVFGGAEGAERPAPGAFAARVAAADLLVHTADDPGRDLLEGAADLAFLGGFAAAARGLGAHADLVVLDTADPARPRARPLAAALARILRGRIHPRYVAGLMRHGPRGAAEMAETVDRLIGFAEATRAVPPHLIELLHENWLGDAAVRAFLDRENPEAAAFIAGRFAQARDRGLWHPRRNDVGLAGEAAE